MMCVCVCVCVCVYVLGGDPAEISGHEASHSIAYKHGYEATVYVAGPRSEWSRVWTKECYETIKSSTAKITKGQRAGTSVTHWNVTHWCPRLPVVQASMVFQSMLLVSAHCFATSRSCDSP